MCGNSAYCWNTMFTGRLFAETVVTSFPSSTTRPTSGVSNPAIIRSVVVLPQPDGNPKAFGEAIEKTVGDFGGTSAGVFWDATKPLAYVLVKGPDDPAKLKGLTKALPTTEVFPLLDEDEVKRAFGIPDEPSGT